MSPIRAELGGGGSEIRGHVPYKVTFFDALPKVASGEIKVFIFFSMPRDVLMLFSLLMIWRHELNCKWEYLSQRRKPWKYKTILFFFFCLLFSLFLLFSTVKIDEFRYNQQKTFQSRKKLTESRKQEKKVIIFSRFLFHFLLQRKYSAKISQCGEILNNKEALCNVYIFYIQVYSLKCTERH